MLQKDPIKLLKEFEVPFLDKGGDWVTLTCPFHKDSDDLEKAHGGINRNSGAFKCFSCSAPGNVVSVIATKLQVPVDVVVAHSDNVLGTKASKLDPAIVEMCHQELLANETYLGKLYTKHGITVESVQKYRLGYYSATKRITIPVYNLKSELINLKQYKYDIGADESKMIQPKGVKASLYLYDQARQENRIFITEGEFKAIILNQYGFNACAGTGGASHFDINWCELFKDKEVIIVYDIDTAGRKGAHKLCIMLWPFTKKIKNIVLHDVNDISNGDITDYFVKKNKTKEDFAKLVDDFPWFAPSYAVSAEEDDNEPIELPLVKTSCADYNGKKISTTAVVSAKDTAPYLIPKKAAICCNRDKDFCVLCPVYSKQEQSFVEVPADSAVILDLINTTEDCQNEILKERAGVYPKCKACTFKPTESHNVEEVRLVPQIAIGHTSEEQCTRKGYYVGHGIAANNTYKFQARVSPQPDDSHATLVIYNGAPVEDDINNFKAVSDLTIFKPANNTKEAIAAKLKEIYDDFADNVTRIYMRDDLHMFYDLVWHSALFFNFQGRQVKGWADALVIGDSGQGKSECSSRLIEHYKCGERVDTKRASIAGIVGGLQETAKRWFITWGTIPLNDRRLVILEEVKGMPSPELAKMTDMRSSGVAEIIKIERAKTLARTRLIWISNPRSDSKISSYNYGVDAVRELIGTLEDIRRFDMVMSVASGEVPIEIVNKKYTNKIQHKYHSENCSNLIGFAWSRKPDDIRITDEAESAILAAANRMGAKYSSAIPIVEPSDQRLKLARLSVSLAIRMYSTDDGIHVNVLPCHVEAVEAFLDRIYSSKSLGYLDFSQAMKGEDEVKDVEEVKERTRCIPNARDSVRGIIECDIIRTEDICNFTEWDDGVANDFIGFLTRKNCLKRSRKGGYRKTSAFIELLKKLDREGLNSETYREQMNKGEL